MNFNLASPTCYINLSVCCPHCSTIQTNRRMLLVPENACASQLLALAAMCSRLGTLARVSAWRLDELRRNVSFN
jgi:hypothetical protein